MPADDLAAIRAAVVKLSDCVGDIAARCWEQLGTVESNRIQYEMNVLGEALHADSVANEVGPDA